MLPQEEFVESHALRKRGWSISAIARHLGRDRKTVRSHLQGKRQIGRRRPSGPDRFEQFEPYLHQRLADDPHVWGTVLYDDLKQLGYSAELPDVCPPTAQSGAAAALPRLSWSKGSTDRPDRAPARGGVPVGLARTWRHPLAAKGLRTGGSALALGQVPRPPLRTDGSAPPGQGHPPGPCRLGRQRSALAGG